MVVCRWFNPRRDGRNQDNGNTLASAVMMICAHRVHNSCTTSIKQTDRQARGFLLPMLTLREGVVCRAPPQPSTCCENLSVHGKVVMNSAWPDRGLVPF